MARRKEIKEEQKRKKTVKLKAFKWVIVLVPLLIVGIAFTWLYQSKDIVRRVGSEVIRLRELELEMKRLKPPDFDQQIQNMHVQEREEAESTLRSKALQNVMKLKAIYLFAKENDINITKEDVQHEVDKFIKDLQLSSGSENIDFRNILADYSIPYRSFLVDMRQQAIYNKVLQPVRDDVVASTEEIFDFYTQYKEYYDMPDQARVMMISVEEEHEADDIIRLLLEGKDFGDLARERSLSPDAPVNSGDIGWVTPGELYKEIADNVFHEDITLDQPYVVRARDGFYIFKVLNRKSAEESSFEDVREYVEHDLLRNKQDRAIDSYMNRLVNDYKPRIKDGNPWLDFLKWLDSLRGRI